MLLLILESHDRIMKQLRSEKENSKASRKRREAFVEETNRKIEALLDVKQKGQFCQLRRGRERFVEHELREEDD